MSESENEIYWLKLENNLRIENRPIPMNVHQIAWKGIREGDGWFKYLQLKDDFKHIASKIKPDVVHAGPIQKVALIPALAGFHPLVSMSWGTDMMMDASRNTWWKWLTSYVLHHSDVMIADCFAVEKIAVRFGFPAERIVIFPWGIDLDKFRPDYSKVKRSQLGWGDEFIMLCTRNWETRYGVDVVVKAFCQTATQMPAAQLVLIGGGSLEEKLKVVVDANHLQKKVHFIGRMDYENLPAYYQISDLYLSASHSDGSSVSLMEALGCGCPVLVSDIPSNLEWLSSREVGWLFEDGNVDDLAGKMISAYQKRGTASILRKNARILAQERADWKKNSKKLFVAYYMALQGMKNLQK